MCFNTKKFISVFLTVAMLFSLSGVPTFAEETEAVTEVIETVEQTETEIEETSTTEPNEEITETEEFTIDDIDVVEENTDFATEDIQLMSENVSLMSTTSSIVGDGTAENPYLITTEAELLALANEELTNSLSANYVLQNDIVVTSTTWVPIGNSTDFSGHFDGNGYTISGIILEGSGYNYTGFFGKNSGLIENLTVDVTFSASNYLGGLVAYNTGTIRNCLTNGTLTNTSNYVGGLVGENKNGVVQTSGSTATVTGNSYVGGLVGHNFNTSSSESATITNCYAQGNITGTSSVGGLVGYNEYTSSGYNYGDPSRAVIRNSYASGKVNDGEGAGLVGNNNGRVYNSYYRSINTGNLTGYSISTTNMKNQDTFYMWDFDNIWEISDNYPYINIKGETETISFNGAGTENNPYLIETEQQLYELAKSNTYMNNNSIYFKLANDIVITAKFWTPIGEYSSFAGVFDGNGYTISGIKHSGTNYSYIGLFGQNAGTIKNLIVAGDVSGQSNVGILAGYNSGTIENCLTKGVATSSSSYVGGLIGQNKNGTIKASGSIATVVGNSYVGGLVGHNFNTSGSESATITNCYAQGNITGTSSVGGLVGYNEYTSSGYNYGDPSRAVIRNSYASGKVNDGEGAGLVGNNNGRVYNSYYRSINTGNLTGYSISTTNMKNQDTFYMWDFDNIWEMNGSYPYINVRGETPEIEFDGDGDVEIPYYVETEEQLYALAMGEAKTGSKIYYQLVNDIAITAKFWTPIGEYDSFIGVFDGNGHTISGVKHSGTNYSYIGLFGQNAGTIKNLIIEGDVSGQSNVGILAGYNSGTIENCLTKGAATGSSSYTGGLVGKNFNGTVRTSGSTATVVGNSYVGGLVGHNFNTSSSESATITNCYAQGNITGTSSVGGLVGYNEYTSSGYNYGDPSRAVIRNSYASGKVNDGEGAGFVGSNNGHIYNSYYNYENNNQNSSNYKNGFPVSLEDLSSSTTFYMWDFDNIWEMNGSYPYINVRGETPEIEFDGDGDVEIPYYVETEEQLYALAMGEAKTGSKIYYQLLNDIAITAKFWTPIGEYDSFIGVFDGNGHTISGVKHSGTNYSYIGLFGQNAGTIKNLIIEGDVSGQSNVGILAGYNSGTIENCLTKGAATGSSSYTGGLVGKNFNGTVRTSGSTATVVGNSYVGGLVGHNFNTSSSESATITNCYAQGNITGTSSVGGLVGYNEYTSSGYNYGDPSRAVIQYSYSIGVVSGNSSAGGLVGSNNGTVTASYYNSETSGQTDTVKGTPVVTDDMKVSDTYAGWDFDKVWAMSSSIYEGYPYLQAMIPVEAVAVTGVKLNKSTLSMIEGNSETLTATITPTNATNNGITWTSSNTSVATVSNEKITAKAAGTATITVTTSDGGYTASCVVTVTAVDTTVSVTGVTLNKTAVSLEEDKTETLVATVAPSNATDNSVSWKSSNTSIATVSSGIVTAKAAGTATITVTTSDGGYTASCVVTVTAVDTTVSVTGVTLNKSAVSLEEGKTETLVATVAPSNATDNSVSWKSSNTGVATVVNGKVTAISAGTAVITVTTTDGGYTANCTVTVTEKVIDENAPKITITDIKTMPGKEIQVTVDLANNTGFASLGIEVGYNSDIMTLTNVTSNTGVGGTFTKAQYLTVNPFNMGWDSASNITYNGNLATLTFTVGEDVVDGIYPITLDYYKGVNGNYVDGDNINYDENFEAVGFVYISGNVIVASYIPGDINGDESVDNKDATYLLRYLAGWSISGLVEDALDVDGSTSVDNKDATILLRYLAGWNVTLH